MNKNIVAIVAHADDEVIGCGGTLAKHLQQGDSITIIYMTDGVSSRKKKPIEVDRRKAMAEKAGKYLNAKQYQLDFPDNQMDQTPLLDIIQSIEAIMEGIDPDIVYTHHRFDLNVDHQVVHQAVMTAFRPIPNKKTPAIYTFEVNSSTEWNTPNTHYSFAPNCFIDISDHIENKIELLKYYNAELPEAPHARSVESIMALSTFRGCSVGVNHAEAFMLMRELK